MNILSNTSRAKADLKQNTPVKGSHQSDTARDSSATKATPLEVNQVLKGEIIDIRANEVKIKLPNAEVLTARLASSVDLYIGQYVSFSVEELTDKILLKPIVNNQNQNSTLLKALVAAGLPVSEKNIAIVNALLLNQMPIDKQTITKILQQTLLHKDASIETLVSMSKNNIPITESNIIQFENYINHEHKLINTIENLSNDISTLMNNFSNNTHDNDLFSFNQQLLSIMLNEQISDNNTPNLGILDSTIAIGNDKNANIIVPNDANLNIDKSTINTPTVDNLINQGTREVNIEANQPSFVETNNELSPSITQLNLSMDDRIGIIKILDNINIPEMLKQSILDNTASIKDVFYAIEYSKEVASKEEPPIPPEHYNTKVINEIINTYENSTTYKNEIGSFMNLEERSSLANMMEGFNIPVELKENILMGSAIPTDILSFIQKSLLSEPNNIIKELLTSKEYSKLFKEELRNQWTMTPKSIVKDKEVDNYYNKIYNQLERMTNLLKEANMQEAPVAKTANSIKDNIDFMKNINDIFSYVQLPIKLKDKNIHSDLYVYTNKKALKKNNKSISALLHLEMDYLGSIDININLSGKNIIAKFYLDNKESQVIVRDNMNNLKEALSSKGFSLNSEVLNREKEVDIVADFIEQGTPSSSLSRYSFDVRA